MFFFFFFNDTATTEIYTLSLHDALPIFFEQRLATEGAAGVYAEFHVADQVLEAAAPVRDVGVGHADDRRVGGRKSARGSPCPPPPWGRPLARGEAGPQGGLPVPPGGPRGGGLAPDEGRWPGAPSRSCRRAAPPPCRRASLRVGARAARCLRS